MSGSVKAVAVKAPAKRLKKGRAKNQPKSVYPVYSKKASTAAKKSGPSPKASLGMDSMTSSSVSHGSYDYNSGYSRRYLLQRAFNLTVTFHPFIKFTLSN